MVECRIVYEVVVATVIVTGSHGLIGAETVSFFSELRYDVVGIDNNMREYFLGPDGSTRRVKAELSEKFKNYRHRDIDIRDSQGIQRLFQEYNRDIVLVVHAAAQPSHDWAAKEPATDFSVNASGTLTLLEATRLNCPDAVFIFTSTNKVYGDRPNQLPLVELDRRFELRVDHPFCERGIDETMTIDGCLHSLFGASKVAADILVQEYGRYFGMKTACFRAGCVTGPRHSGAELHGFLSFLVKCALLGREYTIFGYKGKQVRDNIHSYDFVNAFYHFFQSPRSGEVYNIGGGRYSNCSVLEAFDWVEKMVGKRPPIRYSEKVRAGDHVWWVSDISKFVSHYPTWNYRFGLESILQQIVSQTPCFTA